MQIYTPSNKNFNKVVYNGVNLNLGILSPKKYYAKQCMQGSIRFNVNHHPRRHCLQAHWISTTTSNITKHNIFKIQCKESSKIESDDKLGEETIQKNNTTNHNNINQETKPICPTDTNSDLISSPSIALPSTQFGGNLIFFVKKNNY